MKRLMRKIKKVIKVFREVGESGGIKINNHIE